MLVSGRREIAKHQHTKIYISSIAQEISSGEMSEVIKKSDNSSSQMRLLGWTPHMHKVTIYNKYFLFLLILTHHYPRNDVSQHHQQHVVPGNRVHFRSVIH